MLRKKPKSTELNNFLMKQAIKNTVPDRCLDITFFFCLMMFIMSYLLYPYPQVPFSQGTQTVASNQEANSKYSYNVLKTSKSKLLPDWEVASPGFLVVVCQNYCS